MSLRDLSWNGCIRIAVVVLSLMLLVICVLCLGFPLIDLAVSTRAMEPVAERLGTEPNITAINSQVDKILIAHLGASRDEVHAVLAEIGEFTYIEYSGRRGEAFRENASWTFAKTPWWEYWGGWTLIYDSDERLIDVMRIDV